MHVWTEIWKNIVVSFFINTQHHQSFLPSSQIGCLAFTFFWLLSHLFWQIRRRKRKEMKGRSRSFFCDYVNMYAYVQAQRKNEMQRSHAGLGYFPQIWYKNFFTLLAVILPLESFLSRFESLDRNPFLPHVAVGYFLPFFCVLFGHLG